MEIIKKSCYLPFAIRVSCLFLVILTSGQTTAETIIPPCRDAFALIAIINRPTIADSACTVPNKEIVFEMGYQNNLLSVPGTRDQLYPQTEVRLGLPNDYEVSSLLPNINNLSFDSNMGVSPANVAIKHEIGYTNYWLASAETILTLPYSGNKTFGSADTGVTVNGLLAYKFNNLFSLSIMLGAMTQTEPLSNGGKRFSSINPDIVFNYAPTEKATLYVEVYGQSRTGARQPRGTNADAGIIYLINPHITIDMEYGQRINGNLYTLDHYVGAGLAIMLG